jgi:hypothetical protein
MKFFNIKIVGIAFLTAFMLTLNSCEVEPVENPNGPTLESVQNGATLADLRLLASGLESIIRGDMQFYYWTVSIVGREYWDLNNTDPRYTGELLGAQGAELDNNGFLTTRPFSGRYRAIRNAQVLIDAVSNSAASLTQQEENGFMGYAKTIQAYELLLVLNHQFQNGIRLDVADPDKLGPFVSYDEGLAGIASLLDEASDLLANAGPEFIFFLSDGFNRLSAGGTITPIEFAEFNRAIAARVALYRGNKADAIDFVNKSFMDIDGDMYKGVYHAWGLSGNDLPNPLFYVPNTNKYTVHPSWLADAEAGDARIAMKSTAYDPAEIDVPVTADGLSGDTQVSIYNSNVDQVPLVRNEELILIYAEANIGTDNTEAVRAINAVRAAAGLGEWTGDRDNDAEVLDEVINQRRYGLFGEGHRWIDMRRLGRLDQLPLDRAGDKVHQQFPRPVSEG